MKKVLVVTYGGGHVNMVIPVIKKLILIGYEVKVLGLTTSIRSLNENGIKYVGLKDYLTLFEDLSYIKELGYLLMERLPKNSEIEKDETIAYLGLSYWDLEQRLGKQKAKELYDAQGRYIFLQLLVMERILKHEKPDMVVATNSPRCEQASLMVSHSLGIPNLCIVDLYNEVLFRDRFKNNSYIGHFFVPGGFEKAKLEELGVSRSFVTASGNPSFENHFNARYIQEGVDFRGTNFPNKQIVILFAKTPSYTKYAAQDQRIFDGLCKLLGSDENYGLIVRNHPNDPLEASSSRSIFYSDQSQSVASMLHASDIIVSQGSTVGFEGKFVGKQVFQIIDQEFGEPPIDQEKLGVGKRFNSVSDLILAITNFTNYKGMANVMRDKPSDLIVDYIKKRIEG